MGAKRKTKAAIDTTVTSTPPDAIAPAPPILPGDGIGFVVGKRELATVIRRFSTVVDRKSTMPILAYVTLRADHTGVTITGTDLDVSLKIRIEARVARTGGISLPQKKLADLLKTLPDGDVEIYKTSHTALTLRSGSAVLALDGLFDRDAPAFPSLVSREKAHDFSEYDAKPWPTMLGATLAGMIERVKHAVCLDETRFHLNGIFFESNGTTARMVTTDGHRLAKAEAPIEASETGGTPMAKGVIIPRKACLEVCKWVDEREPIAMLVTKTHAWFRQGTITMVTKLIDAQYPPYEQVIPKDHERLFTVDSATLTAALTRAKVNCSETRGAKLSLATGKLTITADCPDDGGSTITETLDVDYQGEDACIGVNARYLLDTLGQIDGPAVLAWAGSAKSTKERKGCLDPMLVRSLDDAAMRPVMGASFLSVVMPMRI